MEDTLAYIGNKKAILLNDRKRWLEIIEMLYLNFKEKPSSELKELMKFCGEQSQQIKIELNKIK